MSEQGFYCQFPSNASTDINKDNTLSHYTNNFKQPLELKEDYDVGLAEIQYPQSWNNIRAKSNTIEIRYSYPRSKRVRYMVKEVPPGYYENIPDLIDVIKSIYGSTRDRRLTGAKVTLIGLEITYNATTRRVFVNADNLKLKIKKADGKMHTPKVYQAQIKLNDDVARLLGFKNGTVIKKGKSLTGDFAATRSGGLHNMYVYTDCIHPQPHPDGNVNILRAIAIDEELSKKYVSKRFQKIFYYPLKMKTITSISFDLRDDTGKHIGFDIGKVLIVLHFRKRNL